MRRYHIVSVKANDRFGGSFRFGSRPPRTPPGKRLRRYGKRKAKSETLTWPKVPENSSDLDDFWPEMILVTFPIFFFFRRLRPSKYPSVRPSIRPSKNYSRNIYGNFGILFNVKTPPLGTENTWQSEFVASKYPSVRPSIRHVEKLFTEHLRKFRDSF